MIYTISKNKKSNHSTIIILATIFFALIVYFIYQQYYNLLPEEKLALRGAEKIKLAMYEPESLVFYKVFVNTQGNVCYIFSGKNMLGNIGEEQKTVYLTNETLTFNSIKPFEDNCINRQGKDLTLLLKKKYQ